MVFNHDADVFIAVWHALEAMKHIWEPVSSDEYRYWRISLKDMTNEQLETGRKAAETFTGNKLLLGMFRDMCKPVAVPYHKPYNPNQITSKGMTPQARKAAMAELKRKIGPLV